MKKNIDHLFQEKLKDFHEVPDPKVWKSIEASLDNKKDKRRVIPIWWKLGGIAALLALLLYVTNPFNTEGNPISPVITNTETKTKPSTKEDDSKNSIINNEVEYTQEETFTKSSGKDSKNKDTTGEETEGIATTSNTTEKTNDIIKNSNTHLDTMPIVSNTDSKNIKQGKQVSNNKTEDISPNIILKDNTEKAVVINDNTKDTIEKNSTSNTNEKETITEITEEEKAIAKEDNKKSIFDEIKEIEKEEEVAENTSKKWSLGPSIAPVYFDGLGNGSPIDNSFANNTKSGNVNLSYGVVVSYDISKKLSIRSGIHKVDYGYDTNDVSFSPSFNSAAITLDNIDRTSKNINLENNAIAPSFEALDVNAESVNISGNMLQQFGYLEVPLEINYALIDRKFGIDIIGGISSLFLIDNAVLLESEEGLTTEIGEANNINSINFSTNVGLGFNYKFSPKIKLNIEPVFKYQLDTFSRTDNNFRPYSVGVYSGFTIKF